jgi:deazaflavin-dependent oxidoreductase (nitroreductase family)
MMIDLEHVIAEDVCYLTTVGRVTGHPHRVEIWFALDKNTLYFLHEGETADWMKNMVHHPDVTISIKEIVLTGKARLATDREEDARARQLLAKKYQKSEDHLVQWLRDATAVAVDLAS